MYIPLWRSSDLKDALMSLLPLHTYVRMRMHTTIYVSSY